jgi:hypothetical protein
MSEKNTLQEVGKGLVLSVAMMIFGIILAGNSKQIGLGFHTNNASGFVQGAGVVVTILGLVSLILHTLFLVLTIHRETDQGEPMIELEISGFKDRTSASATAPKVQQLLLEQGVEDRCIELHTYYDDGRFDITLLAWLSYFRKRRVLRALTAFAKSRDLTLTIISA